MPRSSVDMSHFGVVDQAVNVMNQVESYISVGMEMTIDVASDVGEYERGNDADCEETLRDVMLDYIKMERDFKQFIESVKYVKQQVEEGAEVENMEDILHMRVRELQSGNHDDGVFTKHEKYIDLMDKIQEVRNSEESNKELKAITQGTEDEEIEMTQQSIVTKCPYTGQEMVNPVKNKICGHNYEKEGILEYISKRKHRAKCPVGGCPNQQVLILTDLEENKDMRKIIERKHRQAGHRPKGDKRKM